MLSQLRQIAIFAKTAEHGSFRKAAAALHLSPSVVSHHIAKLEEELGVALLYRSTRKLSLTSDGEVLLVSATNMIKGAEAFISVATNQKTQLIGGLTISLPAVLERSDLIQQMVSFAKMHTGVSLQLNFSDEPSNLIQNGVDLAIRMGWLKDSDLRARKLYEVERVVVASSKYLATKPDIFELKDVEGWDWIALSPVGLGKIFFLDGESQLSFRPKSRIHVNSAHAMHQIISSGHGIGSLPTFLVKAELDSGSLVRVLPKLPIKTLGVYAVWPPNAPKDGLTRRLVEHLHQHL